MAILEITTTRAYLVNPVDPKGSNTNPGRPNLGNNVTPVIVGPKNNSVPSQNNSMERNWGGGGNTGGGSFSSPRGGGGSVGRPR
ncbi:MAG: hypothetical protein KatS3mg028_0494 [Bacteroidia bacterium]|nr:MAG: hypothetical protein KatS3mg028_0494 [Bacteroidia bacterium]